jgi:hypothetical protein
MSVFKYSVFIRVSLGAQIYHIAESCLSRLEVLEIIFVFALSDNVALEEPWSVENRLEEYLKTIHGFLL